MNCINIKLKETLKVNDSVEINRRTILAATPAIVTCSIAGACLYPYAADAQGIRSAIRLAGQFFRGLVEIATLISETRRLIESVGGSIDEIEKIGRSLSSMSGREAIIVIVNNHDVPALTNLLYSRSHPIIATNSPTQLDDAARSNIARQESINQPIPPRTASIFHFDAVNLAADSHYAAGLYDSFHKQTMADVKKLDIVKVTTPRNYRQT